MSSPASLTTRAFGIPSPNRYWVYYIVKTSADLDKALGNEHNDLVVLMLWAPWSEPSKVMKKLFRDIAVINKNRAIFCMADVDSFKALAERYGAEALPTFVLLKNGGNIVAKVVGAKEEELKRTIASHA